MIRVIFLIIHTEFTEPISCPLVFFKKNQQMFFFVDKLRILGASVLVFKLIKQKSCHHIESSQLICKTIPMTGFYMIASLVFNELKIVFL